MQFSPEQIKMARQCKSADELIAKAKEQGFELDSAFAQEFLDSQKTADLSAEELDMVAGGASCSENLKAGAQAAAEGKIIHPCSF